MKPRFYRYFLIQTHQVERYNWRCLCTILLLIGNLCTISFAQTKIWDKTLGGSGYDDLYSLQQTRDGGYIVGGYSSSNISGDKSQAAKGYTDYWIIKLRANGTREWDKTYGGNYSDDLALLQQTRDGGYILGGTSFSGKSSDKTEASAGHSAYWIVKLKADGSKEWDKTFGGNNENYLTVIQQTSDGGYVLGGYSSSGKSGNKTEGSKGGYDFWVVKTSANGTKEWDKTLGGNGYDNLYSLRQTQDGGYILGGTSASGISGDKTQINKGDCAENGCSTTDYWIVKLNAAGSKEWDKTLGGDDNDRLKSLQPTNDGGYIVGGHSISGKGGDKSEASKGGFDYWVIKLSATGTKEWDKAFGGNDSDYLYSLQQTRDAGFILGGNSKSGKNNDKTEANKGSTDFWVVKISANGIKEWDKAYGAAGENYLTAFQQTNEGDYLLGGTSSAGKSNDKSEASKGGFDFWLVKLKDDQPRIAEWNLRYGGNGNEGFTTIIKTSDGGYLAGGYSNSGNGGDKTQNSQGKNDYWIVKTDKNGKKIWDKRYGGSGDDYLNRIIPTQDGGYLLAGSSLSGSGGDKSQPSRGNRDYWIVKINNNGAKQWDKRYGGSGFDELKKVIQLASGEYLLVGNSNSPSNGDKSQDSRGENDFWLVKINNSGSKIWDKRFGGNLDEALGGIVSTSNDGYLLGGSSASGKNGDKSEESRGGNDFWLISLDKNGTKLWDKSYGGSGNDEAYSLGRTGNDYFISGQSNSPAGMDKTQNSQGGKDFWLIKVTSTGKKIWDKRFGGAKEEELRASTQTNDGGYILAGTSYSEKSGNKSQNSQGLGDYWIVKTNKDGQFEWDKRYGGSGGEELRAVIQANDGGLLLAGKSASGVSGDRTQSSQGGTDYWLVKVASELVEAPLAFAKKVNPIEESADLTSQVYLMAYPNPSKEKVKINFSLSKTQSVRLKVYDSQGKDVITLYQGEATANQTYEVNWQAGNQSTGMYFLQLQTATKNQQVKLLLTK
ncbi:T9SS type A sorting domain-containing protein [Adhaeribacter radiodurans]|uniref:T9SS type A sorting domain-containing protein n=1 Tax=Adhaeribacter radiodurans TaxID=2745197 RepID=A0A7L7L7C4_9BACT|nr:T9SS type A sorting domain-containing protein [Adhaeribacter radiodurans]QMU28654.1 T9SS type A sorting domain-containing protein [Adhaeribacter radiodurans]